MYIDREVYKEMLDWKKRREFESSRGLSHSALSLEGPRQCGKTFLAFKFAKENYKSFVYLNLTFEEHLNRFVQVCKEVPMLMGKELYDKIFAQFNPAYENAPETLVVIDEIQESHYVYNTIRDILSSCEFHFLISGSYLGMITGDREYFAPIGNLRSLVVNPVSFQEYLRAIGEHGRFMGLDLFGKSLRSDYKAIHDVYENYIMIGGYPQAVSDHLEGSSPDEITDLHQAIFALVIKECKKRIKNDLEYDIFVELCQKAPQTLLNEKRGMSLDWREVYSSESKELDYSDVRTSLFYMRGCGLLNYCYLAKDCDLRKQAPLPMRLYYNDVGMAASIMANVSSDQAAGVIAENFVYLSLNGRDKRINDSILHEYPAFGTCEYYEKISDALEDADGDRACDQAGISQRPEMTVGEIDFLLKSRKSKKTWAVEVKKGGKSSKTAKYLLESGKVDCVLYARGGPDAKGGISADGKIATIPIYLIDRFDFDVGYSAAGKP
ncbi:MAG: AAA family ATPase [Clostridiales bacterium]|nr:AAA family ATPase [Clostridiales bacterium]